MTYRAHADNLHNKKQLATLYDVTLLPSPAPVKQIVTLGTKIRAVFSAIDHFIVGNFKDIIQGFAFGFGTTLTVFAFMGLTIFTGCLATGCDHRRLYSRHCHQVGIRYGIKALRNQRLLDMETHGEKPIKDKEQLLDCLAATAIAIEQVDPAAKNVLLSRNHFYQSH